MNFMAEHFVTVLWIRFASSFSSSSSILRSSIEKRDDEESSFWLESIDSNVARLILSLSIIEDFFKIIVFTVF